jgi:hypothetical protein
MVLEHPALSGEVHLWGRVVEHSLGWRAEFAYPKSIGFPTWMIPLNVAEAESLLAGLTSYGVDVFLSDGLDEQEDTRVWTKGHGFEKAGFQAVKALARRQVEPMPIAIFAQSAARLQALWIAVNATHLARVVEGYVGHIESPHEAIGQRLAASCLGAVIVDLNSTGPMESVSALKAVQAIGSDFFVLAVGDRGNVPAFAAAMRVGVDACIDASKPRALAEAVCRVALFKSMGRNPRRKSKMADKAVTPPRHFPQGGSAPPSIPILLPFLSTYQGANQSWPFRFSSSLVARFNGVRSAMKSHAGRYLS